MGKIKLGTGNCKRSMEINLKNTVQFYHSVFIEIMHRL